MVGSPHRFQAGGTNDVGRVIIVTGAAFHETPPVHVADIRLSTESQYKGKKEEECKKGGIHSCVYSCVYSVFTSVFIVCSHGVSVNDGDRSQRQR